MSETPTPPTAAPALPGLDLAAFHETLRNARQRLLDERNEHGWWTGELSSSALSTATAIVAMELARRNGCEAARDVGDFIARGLRWLIAKQNEDGGWGDTDKSKSNISTTMLVWAAMGLVEKSRKAEKQESRKTDESMNSRSVLTARPPCDGTRGADAAAMKRCEAWLAQYAGSLEIPALVEAVMKRYGKDRTFSVPILTMCALCGRLGDPQDRATWKWVKQLPFEFAAFPRSWFKVLNLQVVSYALPALIAIGMVRHHHRATWNPLARAARWITRSRVLKLLEKIQPPNGGFLEATPLTSFVSMSLAACGFATHPVVTRGITFITHSAREDGSWPIDTNLATWVTTLSVNALAAGNKLHDYLNEQERTVIRDWILKQQYKEVHPYTGAAPGGWAWTDLPGGVPDADDTSGAMIALVELSDLNVVETDPSVRAYREGIQWVIGLQNRDGGIPTFCRGWGRLPFDRSSPDITAHFERAMDAPRKSRPMKEVFRPESGAFPAIQFPRSVFTEGGIDRLACDCGQKASDYLSQAMRADGAWVPLWFGNQNAPNDENCVYGTGRVTIGLRGVCRSRSDPSEGVAYLLKAQNADGGWGGPSEPSSIEETSWGVESIARASWVIQNEELSPPAWLAQPLVRGVHWLINHTARGTSFPPSPIGFYFAKLWYYEKLYPIIFTVAALERVAALLERERET